MSTVPVDRRPANSPVEVRPLSVHIGAEIHNVDLTQDLSPATVNDIRQALLRWKVVFFRNQALDHRQHTRFARYFGELTPAHAVFGGIDEKHPAIYSVAKHRIGNERAEETMLRPWSDWHADITAAVNPPFASILRGATVPPYGGDTQWVNMVAVYQSLSPTLRAMLENLRCVHRYDEPDISKKSQTYQDKFRRNVLVAEHPMVTAHAETEEPVLYVNPGFVESIVGLKPHESQALLHLLYEQTVRPEYSVRFKWEAGSIAFWDNRAALHLAPTDIFDVDFDRQFYRVTLMGQSLRGVNGSTSTLISGKPIESVEANRLSVLPL